MVYPIHEKYAALLVNYCTAVQPGDNVLLNIQSAALPMARALTRAVLQAGGLPHLRLSYPEMMADLLEFAPDAYFDSEPGLELSEIKQIDAWIRVAAPTNTRALQDSDETRLTRYQQRMRPVTNVRVQKTRWCGTLFPTNAGAQDAGMSLDAYEQFVFDAMYLYERDPIAGWRELHKMQARLLEQLKGAKKVRIVNEKTDLTLMVTGRPWVNSDGHRNMPSGEIFTSPLEDSAEGVIHFDVPSSVQGHEVAGVTLHFAKGQVVKAHAEKGDSFLQAQLAADDGARYLGELGIGTNRKIQRPTKSILFDEKIGGTVHLALGQSYEETHGKNNSVIHWDLICDLRRGGRIEVDGELFQEGGSFTL